MVVPFRKEEEFAVFVDVLLEGNGAGLALLLLEGLLVSSLSVSDVQFPHVAFEAVLGCAIGEVVHDHDWYFLGPAVDLIDFVDDFRGVIDLEVDFSSVKGCFEDPSD